MAVNAFNLYRVRLFQGAQRSLWEGGDRVEALRRSLYSKPSLPGRGLNTWHIGNVEGLYNRSITFRIGRESPSKREVFDPVRHDFREFDDANCPSALAVIDIPLGVVAIAMRTSLAPNPEGMGRRLELLLRAAGPMKESGYDLDVSPIYDPTDFVVKLRHAYRITSFLVEFRRPNPIDVNKWFQEPLQKALQEAEGEKGAARLDGQMLNPDVLVPIAKAFSATGDQVKAKIYGSFNEAARWHKNKGALVGFTVDDDAHYENIYQIMMHSYEQVRDGG